MADCSFPRSPFEPGSPLEVKFNGNYKGSGSSIAGTTHTLNIKCYLDERDKSKYESTILNVNRDLAGWWGEEDDFRNTIELASWDELANFGLKISAHTAAAGFSDSTINFYDDSGGDNGGVHFDNIVFFW